MSDMDHFITEREKAYFNENKMKKICIIILATGEIFGVMIRLSGFSRVKIQILSAIKIRF